MSPKHAAWLYRGARAHGVAGIDNNLFATLVHVTRDDYVSWDFPRSFCNVALVRESHTNDAPNCIACLGTRYRRGYLWLDDEESF